MEIQEILECWKVDAKIDETDLKVESLRTPELHHKYMKMYVVENKILSKVLAKKQILKRKLTEYYQGEMTDDELKAFGRHQNYKKILKSEIQTYIDTDQEMIKLNLGLGDQQEKVDTLESIIKVINNRGFHIKTAVDFMRFTMGD